MKAVALVPFKAFTRAKRRLRTRYADADVERLGRAMLRDVLDALGAADRLQRRIVLTDDVAVARVAQAGGAEVRLRQPDPGLNAAIDEAELELLREGCQASLVVLGDLPLLRAQDVDAVVEAGSKHAVVIAPSRDGGTALMLRRPPQAIPACFGPGSALVHAREATRRGLDVLTLTSHQGHGLLDLDTPEDALRLLENGRDCRTRALLEELSR
ncbi:MAG: 2-phospho-L-lactate guanylyltransferase [Myxococcota bacterium]